MSHWKDNYSADALARREATRSTPEYRAAAAARSRAWYSKNKARAVAANKKYWMENKSRLQAANKLRYENGGRERDRLYRKARRANDPVYAEQVRNNKRRWRGLPLPTRPEPARCESCKRKSMRGSLCLDHDHKTGKFRGWLCDRCNLSAGLFGDSLQGVLKLVRYLEKNS